MLTKVLACSAQYQLPQDKEQESIGSKAHATPVTLSKQPLVYWPVPSSAAVSPSPLITLVYPPSSDLAFLSLFILSTLHWPFIFPSEWHCWPRKTTPATLLFTFSFHNCPLARKPCTRYRYRKVQSSSRRYSQEVERESAHITSRIKSVVSDL